MSKIVVAIYLVIFSFSYLTGGTVAYFSNSNKGSVTLQAGTWYDGSILDFDGKNKGTVVVQSCPEVEISANFKNVGHKMQGPAEYKVFFSDSNGSPGNHGTSIFTGEFNALDKDEVITLSFEAQDEGFYVFKVYQRGGFESKGNIKEEVSSNKFNIQCKDNGSNKQNTEEQESVTETSEEAVDEASQPEEKTNEEVVEESNSEPVESETSEQDPAKVENNQNTEQNNNATEDVPEEEVNPSEGSNNGEVEAADTNNQPAGEGETNEETN